MINTTIYRDDRKYNLTFPVSELGNAVAVCGWTLVNGIEKTDEVRAEIDRLSALPYLPIRTDWFSKHAVRV